MPGYGGQIVHMVPQAGREASYVQPERPLPGRLQARLRTAGLDRLYSHQAGALDAARRGEHVCVVTGTASGKSLCYLLPILEAVETHPGSTALLLFPTKALLHDQRAALEKLTGRLPVRVSVYDGDSSAEDSRGARAGDIVISNPDKIHRGMIPYATQGWSRFIRNLRFVVVDEAHTYSGIFGGHMGLVLRRLLRMCALMGSRPQVICCSATIGNPATHIQALTGIPAVTVIDENGAPSGPREFVFWQTPNAGAVAQEALAIFLTLLQHEKQTLLFTASRQAADRLLQEACSRQPQWQDRIAAYRAGHLPADRRRIEAGMRQGHLRGLISTNANELGVDIGALDAVVMCGYPGTVASFRQQAGRAGRSRQPALAVLVGGHTPLEAYYFAHPEALVTAPPEPAYLPTTNSHLLLDQVWCAAYDAPLSRDDASWFGGKALLKKTIESLVGRGYLAPCPGRDIGQDGAPLYRYGPGAGDAFPPMMVSLRGMTSVEFTLQDGNGHIIERGLSGLQVQREAHPGAIYYSHHKVFQITDIDY
jgi:DEAD/DEAH box helicase domain-containing protein